MHQFDVFPNPDSNSRGRIPFIVVLQSDLLQGMDYVVCAPLRSQQEGLPIPVLRLNPLVTIEGERYFIRTQELAAIPARNLKNPITNLSPERETILAALDLLFTGL